MSPKQVDQPSPRSQNHVDISDDGADSASSAIPTQGTTEICIKMDIPKDHRVGQTEATAIQTPQTIRASSSELKIMKEISWTGTKDGVFTINTLLKLYRAEDRRAFLIKNGFNSEDIAGIKGEKLAKMCQDCQENNRRALEAQVAAQKRESLARAASLNAETVPQNAVTVEDANIPSAYPDDDQIRNTDGGEWQSMYAFLQLMEQLAVKNQEKFSLELKKDGEICIANQFHEVEVPIHSRSMPKMVIEMAVYRVVIHRSILRKLFEKRLWNESDASAVQRYDPLLAELVRLVEKEYRTVKHEDVEVVVGRIFSMSG
ncbi:hypothetical protein P154DRAFT_583416 [Amniculicola lignicola CBS 123094]|uniref:Uncharacterized protein n=1 Tax=Amniculicola lignicola CBS 123094 TaxID=1392246 RepID=A0A6A5VTJ6_9PLEO|nr:hypothetical protein P154DRAFT_583416 [Amniculicola lignicola CBS 123094]